MAYLIGTDEAGYGPNFGPLVISAAVWQVPDGVDGRQLYQRLEAVVASAPEPRAAMTDRPAIADSKRLYQPGKGLRLLERGLWTALALLGQSPRTVGDVWRLLSPESAEDPRGLCGYGNSGDCAPVDADPKEATALGSAVCQGCAAAEVRLIALRSRVVFPGEFNRRLTEVSSKGEALSRWTLDLAARMIEPLSAGPIAVLCDKHGGRDRYLPLLIDAMDDFSIKVLAEGRQRSTYRLGPEERRIEFSFEPRGEAHLPTALASMTSKYLRELAMRAFNGFWAAQVPGIAPTAGYPGDAARFRNQIADRQKELEIDDDILWRTR